MHETRTPFDIWRVLGTMKSRRIHSFTFRSKNFFLLRDFARLAPGKIFLFCRFAKFRNRFGWGFQLHLFVRFVTFSIKCIDESECDFRRESYRTVRENNETHLQGVLQSNIVAHLRHLHRSPSHVMRLWYISSSVTSFFKRACTAIQWD